MTQNQEKSVKIYFAMLKDMMREEGLCFAIGIDKKNLDNPFLAIVDANKFTMTGELDGIQIRIEKLNEGLI